MRTTPSRARHHTTAMAVVTVAALTMVAGCGDEQPTATEPSASATSASTSPSPDTSPSQSASETSIGSTPVEVYYVVDTRAGLRLAREQREVPADDPTAGGIAAMIAGADDPDYTSTWNPATQVLGVTQEGRTVTVDLSADARTADVGSEGAALMVQQLVYTATQGDPKARVQLLIDGQPAGDLWGTVSWTRPVRRADPLDVRQLVQIDTPTEGATVSSPVTVSGDAAAFEATVPWRVLDDRGKVVQKGFTNAAEAFTFSPYSFTVELDPGTYTIEVREDDPSGGEGGKPTVDTRSVTVS